MDPGDPLRARRLKQMCITRYLMDVLTRGGWDPIHVRDGTRVWAATPVTEWSCPAAKQWMWASNLSSWRWIPRIFQCTCPAGFLSALSRSLEVEVETLATARHDTASLEPDMKDRLLQRALGCRAKCPTCQRVCDDPHEVPGGKHRCSLGHQLRGMAGVHLEDDVRTASTKPCSRIQDFEFIIVDTSGERMTWKAFKQAHPDWDFEFYAQDDVCENEAKFFRSWSQIGRTITEEFGILYTSLGSNLREDSPDAKHWIFVNDTSSSMTARLQSTVGTTWHALMKAQREAFQRLPDSPGTKVTFVNFADSAVRVLVRGSVEEANTQRGSSVKHVFLGGGITLVFLSLYFRLPRDPRASMLRQERNSTICRFQAVGLTSTRLYLLRRASWTRSVQWTPVCTTT